MERARTLPAASLVYASRRYDFDETIAQGLHLVRADTFGTVCLMARSTVREIEINEPLMLASARRTAVAVAVACLRGRLMGYRPLVVSYAIENRNPFGPPPASLRQRPGLVLNAALSRALWQRLDRIAYGTVASRTLYQQIMPPRVRLDQKLVEALPASCPCAQRPEKTPGTLLYLGALSERKGFDLLLQAWARVRLCMPAIHLTIIGTGRLSTAARNLARADPRVRFVADPPRDVIHRELLTHQVLALPSRSTPGWREQVGLPIVEGLAHGCSIVTTDQTGLASWLHQHGHRVLPADYSPEDLAQAMAGIAAAPLPPALVQSSLPPVDGRLAADHWLFRSM
ncbi:glycosyltransferase family 4 protein [Arthrobacter zhaoxinii]|uniref:glycosyltransferase family 4 protein n=1 Tax=Arthrobacter zhaoxinii TaxID=2964616 RepID=UPI0021021971|nr:glycosyltransferase family 4 protein [Arthrobacter zhaoxinii]MCQ2001758.1 glycosyltransferase family 4 protein [Arthrobacter zhaoxinii]